MTRPLRCSFCGKSEHEIKKLVAGPSGIHICDECVDLCVEAMQGDEPGLSPAFDPRSWPTERLLALLKPAHDASESCRAHLQTIVDTLRAADVSWAEIAKNLGVSRQTAWERFS